MSYKQIITDDPDTNYYNPSLLKHIREDVTNDVSIKYELPNIGKVESPRPQRTPLRDNFSALRLPARINNPLIPYPPEIINYYRTGDEKVIDKVHNHHYYHIMKIRNMIEELSKNWEFNSTTITHDINVLKRMSLCNFSSRSDIIHQTAVSYARRATNSELSIIAKDNMRAQYDNHKNSPSISLLVAIHRMRVYIARSNKENSIQSDYSKITSEEPTFKLFDDASYIYGTTTNQLSFVITVSGGHFAMYHRDIHQWYVGALTYLDYMFTVADILNNMRVILTLSEYNWIKEFFSILEEMAVSKYDHNLLVDFMKSLEGFLLNLSDYDLDHAMNWKPILDTVENMWALDQRITGANYPMKVIIALMDKKSVQFPKESLLCRITVTGMKMTRNERQEASSLHKFIFYAEVNARAGVEKFLKRVHTKRPVDKNAIKELTRLAKHEFFLSYVKRHKSIPNMSGEQSKIDWIKIQVNRKDFLSLKSLPLPWWDDITLFNCMDNTLTDDALEFAKDKGALKDTIRLGPGDSRKELLQVIEREDYTLKDFFSDAPFVPKPQKVFRTNHHREPYVCKHPARLIEKEREQKIEARLFGNAELSDKHALSVVATKLKKVLSYYDEQLMTPSDKTRKQLLHRAAQTLVEKDNYSLLLDIEGHNQSMQAENTSELAEFCGLLFGQGGWGTLPDYFSVLDVYHYDEYMDDVIVSNGQYGGIEGWLNPLWTLHTTLCIKLLRYMTSINLRTSMTYSDDVNAIIELPQASEETVQGTFQTIMSHFIKFGMIVKMSQTNLSKHRVTILRQHYADGIRSDSTLKKLISTSGANNSVVMADSLEVAGICSSIASALELSNHITTCIYLKNYKLGLLLSRYTHSILLKADEDSMIGSKYLPGKIATLLYQIKDDEQYLLGDNYHRTINAARNDIARNLDLTASGLNKDLLAKSIEASYKVSVSQFKLIDSPDRMLYLQLYSEFLQDLLFFLVHTPESLGGLGGTLCINLLLSGHSSGFSKSIHYLKEWIVHLSCDKSYFLDFLSTQLTVDMSKEFTTDEHKLLTTYWPGDNTATTVTTSITASIKNMISTRSRNKNVIKLFDLSKESNNLAKDIINIFRENYHQRIAQFYYENSSVHFIDLLVNKIETSSGLLHFVKNLSRLRNSLVHRSIDNIRICSRKRDIVSPWITENDDVVETLIIRRQNMFPKVKMIKVDEPLYDDKIEETNDQLCPFVVRQCSPMHFVNGHRVFDDPDLGNEIRYKGELLDDDRMIGNKEELLAAKIVAVTKWMLTKFGLQNLNQRLINDLDCVKACNLSLSTLTGQNLMELWNFSPNETGGEILHRIPNMRFNAKSYIRSDLSRMLRYTVDLNQNLLTNMDLIDSNVNFDYVRLRILLIAMIRDIDEDKSRFKINWRFNRLTTFHDVQFIKPLPVSYTVVKRYTNYGAFRQHVFSEMRYRFMASYYLSVEDNTALSIIPKDLNDESYHQLHTDLMQSLIYNYSRNLDREYMRMFPESIDINLWRPLIEKMKKLSKKVYEMTEKDQIRYLEVHLRDVMRKKKRITTVSHNEPAKLSMQTQCIEYLNNYRPRDLHYTALINRYKEIMHIQSYDKKLSHLHSRYQNILLNHEEHKVSLSVILICEYILTFHFETTTVKGVMKFDANSAITQFRLEGFQKMMTSFLSPELLVQIMVLGTDFVENVGRTFMNRIKNILQEIADDNHLADMLIPETLPNLTPMTSLDGSEETSITARGVYYESFDIPYSAMESFEESRPLLNYIRKCVDLGADPAVFDSVTGSDSYASQYGLFSELKSLGLIDKSTKICDLTAGRGDSQYVARDLDLTFNSFSKQDAFTQVYYHPAITFKPDYDIFNNASIKFTESYDWVHIDVSFTGTEDRNILDLILSLEERNIAYSVRVNSIKLLNYNKSTTEGIPVYEHKLLVPSNAHLKPYQIYLVGYPSDEDKREIDLTMKHTTAFRSMALSYSRLLSPYTRILRNRTRTSNSAMIYMRDNDGIEDTIKSVCTRSKELSTHYYLTRFRSEEVDESIIYFVRDCMSPLFLTGFDLQATIYEEVQGSMYVQYSNDDIGNVSDKSLPYHELHLIALKDVSRKKVKVNLFDLHDDFITLLRSSHPISDVRVMCNIHLSLRRFLEPNEIRNRDRLMIVANRAISDVPIKNTLHQMEYQSAIKLLILSVYYNQYSWGLEYCHQLIASNTSNQNQYIRIAKTYRMISYCFDEVHRIINSGGITIRDIDAIRHEMIDQTQSKVRYKQRTDITMENLDELRPVPDIIEIDFDSLFTDLEKYANQESEDAAEQNLEETFEQLADMNQLTFDINISDRVNRFLEEHKNLKENRFGMIDLGDDIEDIDDDLM